MPIDSDVAARFALLEGLTSLREAYSTEAGREQLRRFDDWGPVPGPPGVTTRDDVALGPHGSVPVRVYEPAQAGDMPPPCLVWLHGGGFISGDLDMGEADWTAREICARAGAVVVSVGYRLAVGGVHYPVPLDDTVAAVTWVRDSARGLRVDPSRVLVGGASAGGNLAAGAAVRLRDRDGWLPAGLVLAYPSLHDVTPPPSPALAAALAELPPIFHRAPGEGEPLHENYLGGPLSAADGYAFPAKAVLEALCPTLVVNAEYDHLRSSGQAFTAALAIAGVDVRQHMVSGLLHGFLNQPARLLPVGACLELMSEFVSTAHGASTTPAATLDSTPSTRPVGEASLL